MSWSGYDEHEQNDSNYFKINSKLVLISNQF